MKVLLVDDQAFQRKIYNMVLSGAGHEVIEVLDGQEAVNHFESGETVDLILLDAIMPNMDGFETCRRLRAMNAAKDVPIIFLTGNSDDETIQQAFDAGVSDYFVKCATPHDILRKIDRLAE